jgi:uncharacterized membrane protein
MQPDSPGSASPKIAFHRQIRDLTKIPIWLVPMIYALATLVLGLLIPRLENVYFASYSMTVGAAGFFLLSVTSAQAVLSAVASGMMALTAIVFSVAYITVQFNSVAYSPRLALWFARDPVLFHSFGVFIATFQYALFTLAWVDRGGSGSVPVISILIVALLVIASMVLFARLVRGLNDLQVTNTLRMVGNRGRAVIRNMFDVDRSWDSGDTAGTTGPGPVTQILRYRGEPRAVARFDIGALVQAASEADAIIVMNCAVGDTLVNDPVLLEVHGGTALIPDRRLSRAVRLARERTFEQDPKYPIRLLVDIAIKALSPAVNDPTTAVQVLDQIEDLLHRLARRELDAGFARDTAGKLRVIFPMPSWEDYLRLSFDEIRQYGASSVQVMRRLRAALVAIESSLNQNDRIVAVQRYIKQIEARIKRSDFDAQDRAVASQEDRQGLGLSRRSPEPRPIAVTPSTPVVPPKPDLSARGAR